MKTADVDKGFGVSEATGSAKSAAIRNLLAMHRFDPEWTLPSQIDRNPLAWLSKLGRGLIPNARIRPKPSGDNAVRKGKAPNNPVGDDEE